MGEGKGVKSTEIVTVAISNVRSHNNWSAVCCSETRRGRRLAGAMVEAEGFETGVGMARIEWCVQGC